MGICDQKPWQAWTRGQRECWFSTARRVICPRWGGSDPRQTLEARGAQATHQPAAGGLGDHLALTLPFVGEAQGGNVLCSRSHSELMAEWGCIGQSFLDSHVHLSVPQMVVEPSCGALACLSPHRVAALIDLVINSTEFLASTYHVRVLQVPQLSLWLL